MISPKYTFLRFVEKKVVVKFVITAKRKPVTFVLGSQVKIQGCFFHLIQNFWLRIQELPGVLPKVKCIFGKTCKKLYTLDTGYKSNIVNLGNV